MEPATALANIRRMEQEAEQRLRAIQTQQAQINEEHQRAALQMIGVALQERLCGRTRPGDGPTFEEVMLEHNDDEKRVIIWAR